MTDEQHLRDALDYEIEPWTPDPAELIRGGRRIAMVRRSAAATAALAVAGTVGGVAMAVGGVDSSQPPVLASTPSPVPSSLTPTTAPKPTPEPTLKPSCTRFVQPKGAPLPTAGSGQKPVTKPSAGQYSAQRCTDIFVEGRTDKRGTCTVYRVPRSEKAVRIPGGNKDLRDQLAQACKLVKVITRPQPTPVPTSVPAGM